MGDNSDGHKFLAVVPAVHHERIRETLDDGTLRFSETLDSVSAGGVRDVNWLADLDVVAGNAVVMVSLTLYLHDLVH